jgi:signal-transduction protein with cAMP-binding, CBS, and nucleotidyltransferase domain
MSIASVLKGHEFFHNLGMEEVEKVSGFSEERTFEKEDEIYTHAQKADKVYLLLEGSVLLRLPPRDGETRLDIAKVEKGELFGISPLLGAERYAVDALCAEKTEVLAIEAERLQRMLKEDCVAGFVIMSEVAKAYFDRYTELLQSLQSVVFGLS